MGESSQFVQYNPMLTKISVSVFIVLTVISLCAAGRESDHLPEQSELFERALGATGLALGDVKIDTNDVAFFGGDKYKRSIVDSFFANPWRISEYTRLLTDSMLKDPSDIVGLTVSAHKRLDSGVRLGLIGDPLAKFRKRVEETGENSLAIALLELDMLAVTNVPNSFGLEKSDLEIAKYRTGDYGKLPSDLRIAAAQFLFALPEVIKYRDLALSGAFENAGMDSDEAMALVLDYAVRTFEEQLAEEASGGEEEEDIETVLLIETLLDNTDWDLLNLGATLYVCAAKEFEKALMAEDAYVSGNYKYSVVTEIGSVILTGGNSSEVYDTDSALFIFDAGGNDKYESGGTLGDGYNAHLQFIFDKSGNDHYFGREDFEDEDELPIPAFGAGFFGYGVLVDAAGNDVYETGYAGQGFGCFGTGVLRDVSGNDIYKGIRNVQGSGSFGTGLLIDNAGNDVYKLYTYGQGYGFTMGCGYLVDVEGDDVYEGLMDKNPNGGPFGAERHIHFSQGAAYGRRADFTDGHSWAGGFGLLLDGAGNDSYKSEVYGQGTGYWYAVGMLVDKSGDDVHDAGWYSLGGSPHFAIGILQDDAGDDQYIVRQQQCLGNGRDFSIGWFEDAAGDDFYFSGLLSFGAGDVNGLGMFWDRRGDDVYIAQGTGLGQARMESKGSVRDMMLTLGLFIDGGGSDRYLLMPGEAVHSGEPKSVPDGWKTLPDIDFAGNGKHWMRETDTNVTRGAHGSALDAE